MSDVCRGCGEEYGDCKCQWNKEHGKKVGGRMTEMSRAEKCGIMLGQSIIEMANLMYQKNTKKNFYNGLTKLLRMEACINGVEWTNLSYEKEG